MLYLACALTVLIETTIFISLGYGKDRLFILLCIAVNVATNLTINLVLNAFYGVPLILTGELAVVLMEYVIYAMAVGNSVKLLLHTALANIVSFGIGILLFGIK